VPRPAMPILNGSFMKRSRLGIVAHPPRIGLRACKTPYGQTWRRRLALVSGRHNLEYLCWPAQRTGPGYGIDPALAAARRRASETG
jgi:hypothetical protein